MNLHTLTKIRIAHKDKDGSEGILYVHQWPTGFQELIFATEKLAEQFLEHLNGAGGSVADKEGER